MLVAGGFGSSLNMKNAISIGLLPDGKERVVICGNAALNGAADLLLDGTGGMQRRNLPAGPLRWRLPRMSTLRTVIWKACCFQMKKRLGRRFMTSRERVRAAILHQNPDRVPAAFEAVGTVNRKLMEHYGFTEYDQLLEKFEIDVVPWGPDISALSFCAEERKGGNGTNPSGAMKPRSM